jgi:hypothetical protein
MSVTLGQEVVCPTGNKLKDPYDAGRSNQKYLRNRIGRRSGLDRRPKQFRMRGLIVS